MLKVIAFLFVIIAGTSSLHAEVYKYVDKNGQVHFTDRRTAQGNSERVELAPINSIKSPRISQQKRFKTDSRKNLKEFLGSKQPVVMYSAEWCGVCKKAKKYFKARRIPYRELDIDKNKQARREFQMLGGRGVPLILVGNYKMSGFDQGFFDRWRTN